MQRRLSLGEPERRLLVAEAVAFGFSLEADRLDLFCRFADLLDLWSARMSLISCRTARELVERHFVDSLVLGQWIGDAITIVDLGSGAGFPGIPLAIAYPERRIILVEPRRRRANFLREAKRVLALNNAQIVEARAEDGAESAKLLLADAVVCRAVWVDEGVLPVAPVWLRPSGVLISMKGGRASGATEISAAEGCAQGGSEGLKRGKLPQAGDIRWERSVTYRIGSGRRRTLEIYRRRAAN